MKRKYSEYLIQIYVLCDLAVEHFKKQVGQQQSEIGVGMYKEMMSFYAEEKSDLKNLPKKYQTVATLRQLESDLLAFFNESDYVETEPFWKDVASLGLPFRRNDVVGKVLKRGKIRTRAEYDTVIDLIVPYSQEGKITAEDATRLNEMIGKFEELRTH